MDTLIVDLDGTLTIESTAPYSEKIPNKRVIERLRDYQNKGFNILINTARNMNTYSGDLAKINVNTLPIILDWLKKHSVPYDGVLLGKPWCGHNGFYVDDKALRPSEFLTMSEEEINELLKRERELMENLK